MDGLGHSCNLESIWKTDHDTWNHFNLCRDLDFMIKVRRQERNKILSSTLVIVFKETINKSHFIIFAYQYNFLLLNDMQGSSILEAVFQS